VKFRDVKPEHVIEKLEMILITNSRSPDHE